VPVLSVARTTSIIWRHDASDKVLALYTRIVTFVRAPAVPPKVIGSGRPNHPPSLPPGMLHFFGDHLSGKTI
jgi:hypothetical protein